MFDFSNLKDYLERFEGTKPKVFVEFETKTPD